MKRNFFGESSHNAVLRHHIFSNFHNANKKSFKNESFDFDHPVVFLKVYLERYNTFNF